MGLDLNTALISDTFDGLIKTTDGNVLTSSPLVITDGRGNDSSLALATAGNGVAITGTLTVNGSDISGGLATAQADITTIEAKTDFITVTGAVNLDTINTKAGFITVTQAVDLDTIESDIAVATAKTNFITVTQAVNLDTMESDILSAKTKTDFITISQAVNLDTVESGLATAQSDITAIEAKTDFITVSSNVNLNTIASDASAAKTKTDFLTVTQAVNLDTLESDVNVAQLDITAIEAKTDNITVTQAVNLDTMESDIADAKTKTDFITITQAVNLDTVESGLATAQSDINAIEVKTNNITITQPVNLDNVEADTATALANANNAKAKTDFITITQAVNLDTVESGLAQAQTDINQIEAKTNNITVTQAVNLDTMESDIAVNNAKNSYPAGDATKVGFISVTQAVDLDSMETDITNLSANKYDKTGGTISGSVVVTGDLTVNGTTTTVNTQTLSVKDPLIELANDNAANTVDTGFYANYSLDAGVTTKYAGLFKDASDSDKFKLFKGLEVEPTSSVDTAGTGYAKGDLVIGDLNADSGTISGTLSATTLGGTLSTAAQPNITSVGTLSSLTVSGALNGTISTAAQPNITSVGTLSSLNITNDLTVNTNTLFVDASLGRVGINTTPSETFDIAKSNTPVFKMTDTQSGGKFFLVGVDANNTFLRTDANMLFQIGGTERMRISSAGNVGIGTSSPTEKLTVQGKGFFGSDGAGNYSLAISNNDQSNARFRMINTGSGGQTFDLIAGRDGVSNSGFSIYDVTNSATRMRIDSSGNVGIGTSSPAKELEVYGDAPTIRISGNGLAGGTNFGSLEFYNYDGSGDGPNVAAAVRAISQNLNGSGGFLTFETSIGNAGEGVPAVERMRIDSAGNVGIGVVPSAKLHTSSASTGNVIGALFANSNQAGSDDSVSINFGLGRSVDGLVRSDAIIKYQKEQTWTGTPSTVDGTLIFSTVRDEVLGERMRIDSSGNVGIGGLPQTSVRTALWGSGSTSSTYSLICYNSGGFTSLVVKDDRSVNVSGDLTVANSLYLGGTAAANALDDYEEGTFTPSFSTSGFSATYTVQLGHYTKIGRLVHFQISMGTSAIANAGSGFIEITGLPFARTGGIVSRFIVQMSEINFDETSYNMYAYHSTSTTLRILYQKDNAGWYPADVSNTILAGGTGIDITGTYYV